MKLFGTCFSCLHWVILGRCDSLRLQIGPTKPGHSLTPKDPYVERRDMERLNGAEAVSTQDLQTWSSRTIVFRAPLKSEPTALPQEPCLDLRLCLSCIFFSSACRFSG